MPARILKFTGASVLGHQLGPEDFNTSGLSRAVPSAEAGGTHPPAQGGVRLRRPGPSSRGCRPSRPPSDRLQLRGRGPCSLTLRPRGRTQKGGSRACGADRRAGGSGRAYPAARPHFRPLPVPPRKRGRGRRVGAGRRVGGAALGAAAPGEEERACVRACVRARGGVAHSTLCARRMSGSAGPGPRTRWRKAGAPGSDQMRRPRNPNSGPC